MRNEGKVRKVMFNEYGIARCISAAYLTTWNGKLKIQIQILPVVSEACEHIKISLFILK